MHTHYLSRPLTTTSDTLPQLINETLAACILGLKVSTLRKWRVLGRGPVYRKPGGKAIRYAVSDLNEWIRKCECGGEQ